MGWLAAWLQDESETFRLEEGEGSPSLDGGSSEPNGAAEATPGAGDAPPVEGGAIEEIVPSPVDVPPTGLEEAIVPWSDYSQVLLIVLGLLTFALMIALVYRLTRRPKRTPISDHGDLYIDVARLKPDFDPRAYPRLEWMGSPAHLTLLVVAYQGTGRGDLNEAPVRALLDRALPGVGPILDAHRTEIRRWEPQVSRRGFEQLFFHVAALPGDHGRGTPWCSLVVRAEYKDSPLLLGMVLFAPQSPNVTQINYEHESKLWQDMRFVQDARREGT